MFGRKLSHMFGTCEVVWKQRKSQRFHGKQRSLQFLQIDNYSSSLQRFDSEMLCNIQG